MTTITITKSKLFVAATAIYTMSRDLSSLDKNQSPYRLSSKRMTIAQEENSKPIPPFKKNQTIPKLTTRNIRIHDNDHPNSMNCLVNLKLLNCDAIVYLREKRAQSA